MSASLSRRDLQVLAPGLVALVAATSAESLTRAAFARKVSPSTLSRQVARLQADLGVTLFERSGRDLRLTPEGERLVESARATLEHLGQVLDGMSSRAGGSKGGLPRLGTIRTLGIDLVPHALAAFCSALDPHPVQLFQDSTARLLQQLADGEIDLALLAPMPSDQRYASIAVMTQPLELLIPVDHRLSARGSVSFADVVGSRLIVLQPGCGIRTCVEQASAADGVEFDIVLETDDADMVRGFVAAGIGIAIVPHVGDPNEKGLVRLPFREPEARRTICVTWSAERGLDPATAALRDFLVDHLRDLQRPDDARRLRVEGTPAP